MKVVITLDLMVSDRPAFRQCYANWHEALDDIVAALEADLASPTPSIPEGIGVKSVDIATPVERGAGR